jgi:Uncharacterized protein conserved in bacteria (DUF2130)
MATIAEQFEQMQADLTREKAAMNRTWAKREKQIETIVSSTAKFTGELQALYGPSFPQLPQFQLPDEDATPSALSGAAFSNHSP